MDLSGIQEFLNPNAPMGTSSTDYQSLGLAAIRQRKLSEMLRQQLKDNPAASPQMVGGQYIRPSALEGMLDGLRTGLAGFAEAKANNLDTATNQAQQAAAQQWRGSMPTASVQGAPLGENDMGPPQPVTIPPTREAILKHTLEGMMNPLTAKEAAVTNQSLTSDLTRGEDMTFRDQQARQAASERAADKQAQLQARHDDIVMRLEDRNLDRASREQMAKEATGLRAEIAKGQQDIARQGLDLRREIAGSKAGAGTNLKPLPAAQATAYVNNQVALGNIDDALNKVTVNPKAFGLTNMLPNAMVTRMDPKGIEARAAVFNLGSLKIHDRSGAAVTASETPRLLPFIPTPGDDAPTITKKLNGFKREYGLMQQSIEDLANTQGYKSPGGLPKADSVVDFGSLK